LKRYNDDREIGNGLRLEIEQYFHHKWNYDENNALRIEEVQKILDNLPIAVTRMIITDFLFHEFVSVFHSMF
jgi:hypothetical protein